jgi:fatty-acid peroxygenase
VLLDLYGTNHNPRTWVDPYAFRPERFLGAPPGAFEFVPQGGATAAGHHRCPGEDITLALMQLALRRLVAARYRVPPQDLTLAMERLPAQPRSGLVVEGWRAR